MRISPVVVAAAMMLAVACTPLSSRISAADRDPLRRAIVDDVALGVSGVFDPSATTLVPVRTMTGAFDTALMAAMRLRGYRILPAKNRGSSFDCLVEPLEGKMYRVTASVGKTRLSRVWVLDGTHAYPGGAWTRRE